VNRLLGFSALSAFVGLMTSKDFLISHLPVGENTKKGIRRYLLVKTPTEASDVRFSSATNFLNSCLPTGSH